MARSDAHEILDAIPDDLLADVEAYLRSVAGSALDARFASAPIDDEPLTDEDRAAIRRAEADLADGRVYSMAEVDALMRTLGDRADR
ncbi:MAG: hypothetical protein ACKVVT_15295 [Dehalococcoidia bacterium]